MFGKFARKLRNIPTENALFDLADYGGGIVADLFGEEQYFDDIARFWKLQNTAIAKAKEAYLADGWQDVIVLGIGDYFPSYEYVDIREGVRDQARDAFARSTDRRNGEERRMPTRDR